MESDTIRVIVEETVTSRNMRPSLESIVTGAVAKAVDIPINVLAGQMSKCLEDVRKLLVNVPVTEGKTRLKSVEFSLGIDSDGKVSLFSTVTGSVASKTALKVTLDIIEG